MEFSEIAYDISGADEKHEWLELVNETNESIDLSGFYFFDGSYHTLATPPAKGSQGSLVVEPGEYLILADDAVTFLADNPNYQGSVIDTTMTLLNYSATRTQGIELQLANKEKAMVATVSYWPTKQGVDGYTLEKNLALEWLDSFVVGGTPGTENSVNQKVSYSPGIHLSEVVSNPTGPDSDNEWLELENTTNESIDIGGWYLVDKPTDSGAQNRHVFPANTYVPGGGFLFIPLRGSFLNNTDETVSLFWPNRELVSVVGLSGSAKEGFSYSRFGDQWEWTTTLTQGLKNILSVESQESTDRSPISVKEKAKEKSPSPISTTAARTSPKSQPTSSELSRSASSVEKKESIPKKTSSKKRSAKNIAKLSPTSTGLPSAGPMTLPLVTAEVAGITVPMRVSRLPLLWVFLSLLTLILLSVSLIYRYKLFLLIPELQKVWPPKVIK